MKNVNWFKAWLCAVAGLLLLGLLNEGFHRVGLTSLNWTLLVFAIAAAAGFVFYKKWPWKWPVKPPDPSPPK
jgi:hypothetical protein